MEACFKEKCFREGNVLQDNVFCRTCSTGGCFSVEHIAERIYCLEDISY